MKFFEKNIKDRFKNASSLEGIDADDIWNNIESSIETESPKRRFIFFRNGYLLLLLSLFLIGGVVVWNQSSDESLSNSIIKKSNSTTQFQNTDSENIEKENIEKENIDSKNVSNVKNKDSVKANDEPNSTIIQNKNSRNITSSISSKNKSKDQSLSTIVNQKFLISSEKNNNLLPYHNKKYNSYKDGLVRNEIQDESNSIQNEDLKIKQLFDGQKTDFTKIESIDLLLLNKKEDQLALNDLIVLSKSKHIKSKFSLGIFTGIHTMKNNFSSIIPSDNERKNLLNQAFQLEPGYSFALEASFHFNKNISITSGLEYVKSKSEFNFNQTKDTIIVNPNSHVGSLTDAFAERTVRHHNKIEYLSVPILLSFQKSFGKIGMGMSTGVGLNFIKSQTGKSLNFSNQIAIYPTTENDLLPASKFFLSYHLRPYLNYALDEKISFQLRTDFRFQNFGESDFYQLKYSSTFWGLSAGVQYLF